jgi:hypothetical protein
MTTPGYSQLIQEGSLQPDRTDPPVEFEDLPTETIFQICDWLCLSDLRALRLTNRAVSSKATTQAFKKSCHSVRCQLDEQGLPCFRTATQAGGLGCIAQTYIIAGIVVAPKHRHSLLRREDRRKAKVDNALLDEKMIACRQFQASNDVVRTLKECFDGLNQHRPSENKSVNIQIQAEIFDVLDGAPKCTRVQYKADNMPFAIHESVSFAFRTVIQALLNSPLSVRLLCLRDLVLSTFDDIEWNNKSQTGLKDIKVFELGLTMDANLPEQATAGSHGLRGFLSLPSALSWISVIYQPSGGRTHKQHARYSTAPASVFDALLDLQNWRAPVFCRLQGLDVSRDALLKFVVQCPLEHLQLYNLNLNLENATADGHQRAWWDIMEHPSIEASTLETVCFSHPSVNGRLGNSISRRYVRSAGPLSSFVPADFLGIPMV